MRLKFSHPPSISPEIAFEPLGQLVTKSQIHHVPARLIKAHTLGELRLLLPGCSLHHLL